MKNKIIIFIITLYCNNMLIGMKLQKQIHKNNQQSWSLDTIIKNKDRCHYISSICIDPSEKLIAVADCNQQVCIRDIILNTELACITLNYDIHSICFDHSGKKLAVLSYESIVDIFDIQHDTNKKMITYNFDHSLSHTKEISSIFFDKNNNIVGIQSNDVDGITHIIDLATNTVKTSFPYDNGTKIASACQSGRYFATSSNNKTHLFDTQQKRETHTFKLQDSVNALAFDKTEKLLAIASRDNEAHIFDVRTCTKIASFPHKKYVSSICFGPSGKTLATGSYDGKIRIFKQNKNSTLAQHAR
jgi:WD40 repeat protein